MKQNKTPLICVISQVNASNIASAVKENIFRRLPGLCRRLKRRRVTVLVKIN